jgi:hypothetical protein
MKFLAVAFALILTGCANQKTIDQIVNQVGADCTRHYAGQAGGMAASFSFDISCQPSGTVTTTTVTVPAKP